jgi:hypothetical protein
MTDDKRLDMRQACKDMRHVLIYHFGYKDIIKDSVNYIDEVDDDELQEIHRRLLMIVKSQIGRKKIR